jgi:micrococcal nuclease
VTAVFVSLTALEGGANIKHMRTFTLLAVLLISPLVLWASPEQAKLDVQPPNHYTVAKVIHGNTLELSNGEQISLIGINTDTQPNEAAEFVRGLVEGKQVRLEYDAQKIDHDGKTLAYVYRFLCSACAIEAVQGYEYSSSEDGTYIFVNGTILKSGYGTFMTNPSNLKYFQLFQRLYKEAVEAKRGLWKSDARQLVS